MEKVIPVKQLARPFSPFFLRKKFGGRIEREKKKEERKKKKSRNQARQGSSFFFHPSI